MRSVAIAALDSRTQPIVFRSVCRDAASTMPKLGMHKPTPRSASSRITLPSSDRLLPSPLRLEHRQHFDLPGPHCAHQLANCWWRACPPASPSGVIRKRISFWSRGVNDDHAPHHSAAYAAFASLRALNTEEVGMRSSLPIARTESPCELNVATFAV